MGSVELTTRDDLGVTVARVEGEIDKLAVAEASVRLEQLTRAGRLVLDLEGVPFIDSAGLHALFRLGRSVRESGGRVALSVPASCRVARAIAIVHLGDVVPIYPTVGDAVAALSDVSEPVPEG